jgi:cobalt-zinc-cadmium efflux system membrane fusion protein
MKRLDPGLAKAILVSLLTLALACTSPAPESDEGGHEDHDEDRHVERVSLTEQAYATSGISVAPVELRALTSSVRVTGTLSYDERKMAIATARIGGRITRVVADYGQQVAEGAALAWIDSPELGAAQADYRRAVSMTRLRKAEYDRALLLVEGEAISRGELLRREADLRATEADLQTAEQKLHILGLSQDDVQTLAGNGTEAEHVYPVRAPLGGRVTERRAVPGRVVGPDNELFTIASLDTLWLFLQVFEKDLPSVSEGASVTLTCESHPDERFRGTIDFVGQVLDPHSRTVSARAVIDNPHGDLKPGMFVYATIESASSTETPTLGTAVPAVAVADIDGANVVFVQVDERTFELREITVGRAAGDWVEVRSGVEEGEPIAVADVFTLKSEVQKGGLEGHEH